MSVNRNSELDTSLSRTDGVHRKYLNLTSSDRDKTLFPDAADAELHFDTQSNVIGLKIINFEIPHTRYAIDKTNNNLYISEKWGDDEYHFFSLRASAGGHSVQNLGVSLELSSQCPVIFNGDRHVGNEYSFDTSLLYGKMGITSSGNYDYTIHAATETVTLSSMVINSETEAVVSYLAPADQVFKPGALLVFQPYTYTDRDIQVVDNVSSSLDNAVRVIGDFSDLDPATLDFSKSRMVPYSGVNSVARILGFGGSDVSGQTNFEILAIASPFSGNDVLSSASVMVATNFTAFVSEGDYVELTGIPGFMNNMICEVSVVHDETHFEVYVNRASLWSHDSGTVAATSDPGAAWGVDSIGLSQVDNNTVDLQLTLPSLDPPPVGLSVGAEVQFAGFHSPEFQNLRATVTGVEGALVTVRFNYPCAYLMEDGVSSLCPVNPTTTLRTTYLTPYRFDLSRGRRMVLCRAVVDNQDVGSIHIPSLSTRSFFGRIQLFSGGDLVNFLSADTAVGSHEFNSVLKRFNKIRLEFFNEDGTRYDFIGVDYTMFLELTCLDSNKGL